MSEAEKDRQPRHHERKEPHKKGEQGQGGSERRGAAVIERCTWRRAEGRTEVEVELSNPGPDSAFAVAGVRRVDYDREYARLTLWFSDRGGMAHPQGRVRKEFVLPRSKPIEPGGRAKLTASVRDDLTRLVPDADGFHLEQIEAGAAREVEVVVSVADTPFYFNPTSGDVVGQLERWGDDLRATAQPEKPKRGGGKAKAGEGKKRAG